MRNVQASKYPEQTNPLTTKHPVTLTMSLSGHLGQVLKIHQGVSELWHQWEQDGRPENIRLLSIEEVTTHSNRKQNCFLMTTQTQWVCFERRMVMWFIRTVWCFCFGLSCYVCCLYLSFCSSGSGCSFMPHSGLSWVNNSFELWLISKVFRNLFDVNHRPQITSWCRVMCSLSSYENARWTFQHRYFKLHLVYRLSLSLFSGQTYCCFCMKNLTVFLQCRWLAHTQTHTQTGPSADT